MKNTTLCYIERGDEYLMLHRTAKEIDENKDKWIALEYNVPPKFPVGKSGVTAGHKQAH